MAIATNTAPADWANEDDATLATAIDVLEKTAAEIRKGTRRGH